MGISKPVFLVGESWGDNEARIGKGFCGPSGVELLRMLNEANVIDFTAVDRDYISRYYQSGDPKCLDMVWQLHDEVFRTNVFNIHPPANNLEYFCGPKSTGIPNYPSLLKAKHVQRQFASELDRLGDEILSSDPNLIVCLGNSALWALAGRTGVTKLRGTTCVSTQCVSGYKLLVAYHPAAVIRQWELRPVTLVDFAKINREKEFPDVRRPNCQIWIEPTIEDFERFIRDHIHVGQILSVDIETSGNQITCIGFAPRRDLALVVPIHDERAKTRSYWATQDDEQRCWGLIRSVLEDQSIPKVFQNGLYDIAFLWRAYGIRTFGAAEDTMLLHHSLQPESLKGLAFLGSVYTDHGPWKSERKGVDETIKRDA